MKRILLSLLPVAALAASQPVLAQASWTEVANAGSTLANYPTAMSAPALGAFWFLYGKYLVHGIGYSEVFQSADGGQTANSQTVGTRNANAGSGTQGVDLCALNNQVAWVLLDNYAAGVRTSSLLATTTGPAGLAVKNGQLPATFSKIQFFTATTGLAAANPVAGASTWPLYKTTDGGATWQLLAATPAITNGATTITGKHAIGNSWWLTTDKGDVLHTSNQGQTWALTPGLGKVAFEDELRGLAYTSGSPQQLLRTLDGGLTWAAVAFSGQPLFTELAAVPGQPGTYLSVGSQLLQPNSNAYPYYNGVTGISRDRGATWTTLAPTNILFQHVVAAGPADIWASGADQTNTTNTSILLHFMGSPLAASSPASGLSLALYPNPTTGRLNFAPPLPGEVEARVYNAVGQLCQITRLPAAATTLDLSGQPAGIYEVQLSPAAGARYSQRIVKLQ